MTEYHHAGYGVERKAIFVTPIAGHKKNQVIAKIGKLLCFFDETDNFPELAVPVEVMIKNPLLSKKDSETIIGFRVKVVDRDRHELIAISGFERSGFTGATTATGFSVAGNEVRHYSKSEVDKWPTHSLGNDIYTPGKTKIRVADNRTADRLNNGDRVPLVPTNVWVNHRRYEGQEGPRRVLGLAYLEDADYFDSVKERISA